jgi:hypothetical protein
MVAFIRKFRKLLDALSPGDFMLIPGGWVAKAPHNLMFVLERQESTFRLAVCNTGNALLSLVGVLCLGH